MRALVLAGGGSKGAYQVGALKRWMFEEGREYDLICGTSVGAINAAYLAQCPLGLPKLAYEKLRAIWDTVETSKVRKRWFPFGAISALWKSSVYDSSPVQAWIRSGLNAAAVRRSGRKLRVVAVSLGTGETNVATEQDENLVDWVIASSAFPVMLTPARIDGDLWTDGGLRNVTPLGEAIRAGATEIDVIMCSDPWAKDGFDTKSPHAFPGILLRAIDVMNDQVARADLQIASLKNDLSNLKPEFKKVTVRVLEPSEPLPFDSLNFDQTNIQAMIELGYQQSAKTRTL